MQSVQVTVSAVPAKISNSEIGRRSANFHPSIWGDRFLTCIHDENLEANMEKEIEGLKAEVKRKFIEVGNGGFSQQLVMIDAIQQLGLAYHFEKEIEEVLAHINNDEECINKVIEPYIIALRFRLLRQQGYNVPCDIFYKLKDDNNGDFKESLGGDVMAMLSLYEAAQLRVHDEDILEEALAFCVTRLESMAPQLNEPLKTQVANALIRPIRRNMPRIAARKYIDVYQQNDSHDDTLLKLAKLDFNLLQHTHQKELSHITKWWKDLDFAGKLPFGRDRLVEVYFWMLGVYFEPEYAMVRKIVTKVTAMISYLDDIYDVYGTIDELQLFTEAIQRWDVKTIDQLPEYMKIYYVALIDVYRNIEEDLKKDGRSYRLYYAQEAMKNLAKAYHAEAKWLSKGHVPTMEDYMAIAMVSCGYANISTTSLVGMGDIVTKENIEWVFNRPKILKSSEIVCRLMDDIVSHKFEQKRGHAASSVECYMKQHGVSEEKVREVFLKQVADAWKDINQACLMPTEAPRHVLTCILNLTRVIDVIYKEEDGYTHAGIILKDYVSSLLIHPIPMSSGLA